MHACSTYVRHIAQMAIKNMFGSLSMDLKRNERIYVREFVEGYALGIAYPVPISCLVSHKNFDREFWCPPRDRQNLGLHFPRL